MVELLNAWILNHGLKIILILFVTFLIIKVAKAFAEKVIRAAIVNKNKKFEKKREDTLIKIVNNTFKFIWLIAILTILPEFGVNIAPILAGVGLLGLAIGMGAKNVISDFVAGIFIIFEDQYEVGDEIEIAGIKGKVLDIDLRKTILKDKEGVVYFVPNGQIKVTSNKSR